MKKSFLTVLTALSAFAIYAEDAEPVLSAEDILFNSLVEKNPFGTTQNASISEVAGISFKSAVFIDGQWRFSVVNKEQKSVWLALNEDCEIFQCKIISFDEDNMSVKALIASKTFELKMTDRASFSVQKATLNDGIIPNQSRPRNPAERAELWKHATEAQINEANAINAVAKSQNRALNRDERRQIEAIERSIKVPEKPAAAK